MDPETRRELINRYRQGPAEVRDALSGASDSELDARPAAGEWSAREVAHHLADSETMASIRLRRLLAEEQPLIAAYDENEWARTLHYDRPVEESIALFDAVRAANAALLERLDDAAWSRAGTHSESGAYSVTTWLEIYANHAHDHADQIRKARASA